MKEEYKEAFAEVEQIFSLMPTSLLKKIPNEFKEIITKNKSNTYRPNIHAPFEKGDLKYETNVVLALIYRDFLCTSDERKELVKGEKIKLLEFEKELREKYNPEDIFKKNNELPEKATDNISVETKVGEYKEKNFVRKLFAKIKYLFIKNS